MLLTNRAPTLTTFILVSFIALLSLGCSVSHTTHEQVLDATTTVALCGGLGPFFQAQESPHDTDTPHPAPYLHLAIIDGDTAPTLLVESGGLSEVTLQLMSVTLGEALMVKQGGRLADTAPALGVTLTLPASMSTHRSTLDLRRLPNWQRGLLAVTSHTVDTQGQHRETHELLTFGTLQLNAHHEHKTIRIQLSHAHADDPIHDAWVELINADGQTLAHGRTDAQGLLTLERPPLVMPALLGDHLYVTARHKHARALLQLPSPPLLNDTAPR